MSDTTPEVPLTLEQTAEEPTAAETPAIAPAKPAATGSRLMSLPATKAGWWAVALEVVFLVLYGVGTWLSSSSMQMALWGNLGLVNDIMFVATPVALVIALAGILLALGALIRGRERSLLVWLAAVVPVGAVVFSLL